MEDDEPAARRDLSRRVEERQIDVAEYLRRARPRRNKLSNVSIVGSSVVAVLTAGPAVGQTGFTEGVAEILSLENSAVVWQVICLLASVLSVGAAMATNFANSRGLADQIGAAEASGAELEGLQAALTYGNLPLAEAVQRYQQSLSKASFIEAGAARRRPA